MHVSIYIYVYICVHMYIYNLDSSTVKAGPAPLADKLVCTKVQRLTCHSRHVLRVCVGEIERVCVYMCVCVCVCVCVCGFYCK